jgi:hypothetical protein
LCSTQSFRPYFFPSKKKKKTAAKEKGGEKDGEEGGCEEGRMRIILTPPAVPKERRSLPRVDERPSTRCCTVSSAGLTTPYPKRHARAYKSQRSPDYSLSPLSKISKYTNAYTRALRRGPVLTLKWIENSRENLDGRVSSSFLLCPYHERSLSSLLDSEC